MSRYLLVGLLVHTSLCASLLAQQQPANEPQFPTIRTTTHEVLLDVIVRDKHSRPVTDLRPDEIEVLEDGVRQQVHSFRDVKGAEQLQRESAAASIAAMNPAAPTAGASSTTSVRQTNFVAIVLAQIAPLNLEFAREAVQDFLKSNSLPNTYVTVYQLGRGLDLVQSYTSDNLLLTRAVDKVTRGLRSRGGSDLNGTVAAAANSILQASVDNILANPQTSPGVAQAVTITAMNPLPAIGTDPLWARNAASQDVSITLGSALLAQARLAAGLRFVDNLSGGMDTMDALRHLVRSQQKLPGRKVVIYLADGLALPMARRDVVQSLISFANQEGVVFYTVDTRGLSVDDPVTHPLASLVQAASESSVSKTTPRVSHLEDDDIALSVASNTQLAMEEVAESTGGFAVVNTNQIAQPMQRMMEDIRDHYELAYTPTSTKYDGHFRTIEVHVRRPRVKVQTRKGYFALPDINGEAVQAFEMPALTAINQRPAPAPFPYHAALIKSRPRVDAVGYEVAFDIPISSLRVVMNHKTGKSQVQIALFALIQKADGEVVGKISRILGREVNKAELRLLGKQHILYAEPIELRAGHYLVRTAVTDEQAEKTSAKDISLFVDSGKTFGLSSVQLVKNIFPLSGPRNPSDPFQTDSLRILPTLSESVPVGEPVDVYFVVFPNEASGPDSRVTLQMFQDGKEISRRVMPLPEAEPDGSIPMLVRLTPGEGKCDVIVTAQQGNLRAQSGLSIKIGPSNVAKAE